MIFSFFFCDLCGALNQFHFINELNQVWNQEISNISFKCLFFFFYKEVQWFRSQMRMANNLILNSQYKIKRVQKIIKFNLKYKYILFHLSTEYISYTYVFGI